MKIQLIKRQFYGVLLLAGFALSAPISANSPTPQSPKPNDARSMYKAFGSHFDIGAAVNSDIANEQDLASVSIVNQHFNSLTAENDMKWENIQATEGEFDFDAADALVKFAKKYNKRLVGHVLVWHSQTPDWVFEDADGEAASRELLLQRMKTQIFALAGRYKDDIQGWDVVNEALNEDGSMRDSKWRQIIGDDYIEKAFEYASQAAPNAALYYNDYNLYKADKMDGAIAIAKRLLAKGIRIDGIGIQGHYGLPPPVSELEQSILKVANIGLTAMITELDLTVLKFPDSENMGAEISLNFALQDSYNPYAKGMDEEAKAKLAKGYIDIFRVLLRHRQHINRVTIWGVSDRDSWRNNWPMRGRTDYPLLFDRDYNAKPFVTQLIDMAEQLQ